MFALKEDKHLIDGMDGNDGMDGLAVMENPDFENEEMNHHDWMYEMTSFKNHVEMEDEEETFSQYNLMLENADDFDFKVDDLEDLELADLDLDLDNIDNIDNSSEVLSTVSTSTTLTLTANKKEDTKYSYPLYSKDTIDTIGTIGTRYTRDVRDFKTRLWDEHLATKRYRERILDRRRMDYEFHKKYEKFLEDYFREEEDEEEEDEIYTKESSSSEKIAEEDRPIEWAVLYYRVEKEDGSIRYVETDAKEEIKIDNETITMKEETNMSPPLSPPRPCVWKKIETKVVPLSFDVPTVVPEPSPSPPPPPSPSPSSSKNYKNKNHPPHSRRHQNSSHRSSNHPNNLMEKEEEVVVVVPTKMYPRLCKHGRYCKRNQTEEKCNMAHALVEWDPSCQRGTKCNRGKNCMYWHEEANKETKQQYLSRMIHDVPNNYFSGITSYEKVYVHSSRPQKK